MKIVLAKMSWFDLKNVNQINFRINSIKVILMITFIGKEVHLYFNHLQYQFIQNQNNNNHQDNSKMGLWPWLIGHMFTPRFWKSVKFDGYLMTYQRGHKAVMNSHSVGGNSDKARYVGMDQFGNKYYEDFDALHYNQFRWVEYNNFLSVRSPHGDKIPPKWHGWLHKTYDDEPLPDSDSFHDPFFQKPHQWDTSVSAFRLYTSRDSQINQNFLEYKQQRFDRYAKQWQPKSKRA